MQIAYISLVVFLMIYFLIYYSSVKPAFEAKLKAKNSAVAFAVLLVAALVIRMIIAAVIKGFSTDISCFKAWADMAYKDGLQNFYFTDTFADYPPGYVYVLWVLGFLKDLFGLDYASAGFTVLIKMPAIICDVLTGLLIYKAANENEKAKPFALSLAALYMLNPAVIINSSAWGQVDSVYALFVALFIYLFGKEKYIYGCFVYAVGFMIKPQMIIFAPVVICYFLYRLIFKGDIKKLLTQTAVAAAGCISLVFIIALPFAKNFNFMPIIEQYISTIKSYPYASVNAYNLFMLAGGNWQDINARFLFLDFAAWSNIFIVLITAASIIIFIKSEGRKSYFEIGAFIICAVFTMAGKMHERYVFPAMLLLIMAFVKRPDKKYLFMYMAISVTQLLNAAIVLYQDMANGTTAMPGGSLPYIIAMANVAILVYMIVFLVKKPQEATVAEKKAERIKTFSLMKSEVPARLVKYDYIIMAAVTLIYSVVAFVNLGDVKAAQTHTLINPGTTVTLTFDAPVSEMKWYSGYTEERQIDIFGDGQQLYSVTTEEVFAWHEKSVEASEVEIYFYQETDLIELAFYDKDGNYMMPEVGVSEELGWEALFDEGELVPENISYKNSAYFDEIYHARTAYEYLNSLEPYENTHPPLGKLIIGLGVMIFGMTPFGWRFSGTLCGIIMLPVIYIFAKRMFKSTKAASFVMLLFALDFMHFVQTRIATIDVYVTLFIILMFYFMYRYTTMSFYDTPLKKTLVPLGLSGLFFGLAVASKWTGLYGGAGLCVIFFASLGRRIYEYYKINGSKNASAEDKKAVSQMKRNVIITLAFCVGAFVIIPALIYCVSYIPYLKAPGMQGISSIIENQKSMFDYHSKLDATHPYSSFWYQWPINYRPVWYYTNQVSENARQTIASFGNPLVWWVGFGALVFVFIKAIKTRKADALFLCVAFLAQYLPWVGVSRCVFLYHYFPSVPFIIMALGYMYSYVRNSGGGGINKKRADAGALIFVCLCAVLFAVFYPVLSGTGVGEGYIEGLRIFPSWYF